MDDYSAIIAQLESDGVAFHHSPADKELETKLIDALASHPEGESLGIVVAGPGEGGRNLAEDVLLATELDSVIVRTPEGATGATNDHTRASFEAALDQMAATGDYVEGLHIFLNEVAEHATNWALIAILLVAAIALVAFWMVKVPGFTKPQE